MSEHQLILQYKETKNQRYLGQLYDPYMTLIYGTCLKYLKSTALAEDAVMDIYESLISKVLKYDIDNFRSWIYRISVNHCLEIIRKDKRHHSKKSDAELMYTKQIFHPDDVQKEKDISIMEACIDTLQVRQKECIQQFYLHKKSYKDIADILSLSYQEVRSAIQNGRRQIKLCMTKSSAKNQLNG